MLAFHEPEFVEPDPIDPMDRNWQAPPEPDPGPSWWLFGPEESLFDPAARCAACAGDGTLDGFEPCATCHGSGERPGWWS